MKFMAAGWLACLLFVQDPSPKKPTPVTVRVETLFESGYTNHWHTLILEVTNQTPSDQEFRITVDLGWSDRAERREKFAPKVLKRIFLYLPATEYSYRVNVHVEDAAGRELLSESKEMPLSSGSRTGVTLIPFLADRAPTLLPSGSIARVIPEPLFPDRWIGLAGLGTIYIHDYKLDSLLPAQRAALLEWIRRGGHVVLSPGSNRDWLLSPALQEIAPVILGESTEATELPPLEGWLGAFRERTKFPLHQIRNGEPVESVPGGTVRFRNGLGSVVVTPFDLERAPFDSWPSTPDLWRRLAEARPPAPPADVPRLAGNPDLIHDAATSRVNRQPPFLLLLGLSTLYLVVIGPVNFLVLRRLRMTVRLVFTIPAISALFLGLVILSGYVLRGTSTVTFEVCVLEAAKGNGFALEYHHFSLFAASHRTFDITFGQGETGRPQEVDFQEDYRSYRGHRGSWGNNPADRVTYDQTDQWTLRDVGLKQWQSRAFIGEATRPIGGGVVFQMGAELEITNRTPYTIRRGWALTKEPSFEAIPFGEVPAGETRRFPMTADPQASNRFVMMREESIEDRIVSGWCFRVARMARFDTVLLCTLDRLPDETRVDARRSSDSQRLCFLQVGGAR